MVLFTSEEAQTMGSLVETDEVFELDRYKEQTAARGDGKDILRPAPKALASVGVPGNPRWRAVMDSGISYRCELAAGEGRNDAAPGGGGSMNSNSWMRNRRTVIDGIKRHLAVSALRRPFFYLSDALRLSRCNTDRDACDPAIWVISTCLGRSGLDRVYNIELNYSELLSATVNFFNIDSY